LPYLLHETFADGQLTAGLWRTRLRLVTRKDVDPTQSGLSLGGLNNLGGGYLHFWDPRGADPPYLCSTPRFDRRPGRCLVVGFCGTVHRGGPVTVQFSDKAPPDDRFGAGPGWAPGQSQGPPWVLNTALPFDAGRKGPAQHNDNLDTLFLTVLREQGAFYLTAGEPTTMPPKARLCYVSHGGHGGPYHVALTGGPAHARFYSVAVLDLPGPWQEPLAVAEMVDCFDRTSLGRPDRGGTPWQPHGTWTLAEGKLTCHGDGVLLTDFGSSHAYVEVLAAAGEKTDMLGIVLRAKDADNLLRFELRRDGARLVRRASGEETGRSVAGDFKLTAGSRHRLAARLEGNEIALLVDDAVAGRDDVPPSWIEAFQTGGTRIGMAASGGEAVFAQFVNWPLYVDLPGQLAGHLPPVPLKADGQIVLQDDFEGGPGAMDGRRPKIGSSAWQVRQGTWTVEDGAAVLAESPGMVLIDCGQTDYEISSTIDMRGTPDFPGFYARVSGPSADGQINARFLWQNASPEIEIWDRPAATPENLQRWGRPSGGIPMVLVNATNISWGAAPGSSNLPGRIRPGQRHVLRLVVRGNRLSYFCDDVLVGTAPTRVPHGTWIGLGMSPHGNAQCRWQDLTVRAFKDEHQPTYPSRRSSPSDGWLGSNGHRREALVDEPLDRRISGGSLTLDPGPLQPDHPNLELLTSHIGETHDPLCPASCRCGGARGRNRRRGFRGPARNHANHARSQDGSGCIRGAASAQPSQRGRDVRRPDVRHDDHAPDG
jgi:hypothetical protein